MRRVERGLCLTALCLSMIAGWPLLAATPIDAPSTSGGNDRVSVGHDIHLPQGQEAGSVVAVGGSANIEGQTHADVAAVFGNARVTGPVGGNVLSVFGSTYIDSSIQGDAVAVFGSIRLGPNAQIAGDVVDVGGAVERDPMAIVHGRIQQAFGDRFGAPAPGWLMPWVRHGLFYLRPLAWGPGLGWIWVVAFVSLLFYLCLALLFRDAVSHGVQTFEQYPARALLAALLTALLTPIVLLLLVVTLIGIPAIPLVLLALLCAWIFGKVVMLTWIGRRCLAAADARAASNPAASVLIGGLIMLVVYFVPVVGFLAYQVLGVLGLGVVVYTLIHRSRERGPAHTSAPPTTSAPPPAPATPPPAREAAPLDPLLAARLPRAGFWVRMVALLLDALLIGLVIHLLPDSRRLELLALAAYGAVMWKLRGTTIGGIVFDLQVVRLDGRPIDWTTAIVRALGCFLSLAIVGLGFFWIAFDDGKQAWHDKFAGTAVVRVAKAVSLV